MSLVPIDRYTPEPFRPDWIGLMEPAADLANQIANTDFVPNEFRNKPAAIAACILFGAELGLGPMVSLSKIDIVKGRPAPRAEIGRALALAAGHEMWVEESANTRVTVAGKRRGSNHVHTVTWTMDDAKKAGIAGNTSYAKYPRQMLLARASAELVRQMCPEVIGGITVFAEEAGDPDNGDTPTVTTQPPESPPGTRKRSRPVKAAPEPTTPTEAHEPTGEDTDDGRPHPDELDGPSPAQTALAMANFKDIGITARDDRIAATSALINRTVTSWNDLTRQEASTAIDGLERLKAGQISFTIDTHGQWKANINRDELLDDEPEPEDAA